MARDNDGRPQFNFQMARDNPKRDRPGSRMEAAVMSKETRIRRDGDVYILNYGDDRTVRFHKDSLPEMDAWTRAEFERKVAASDRADAQQRLSHQPKKQTQGEKK